MPAKSVVMCRIARVPKAIPEQRVVALAYVKREDGTICHSSATGKDEKSATTSAKAAVEQQLGHLAAIEGLGSDHSAQKGNTS